MPYQFPSSDLINITDVHNPGLESEIQNILTSQGINFTKVADVIVISGAGVGLGDHSVDLIIDLAEFDGTGVLMLQAKLAEHTDSKTLFVQIATLAEAVRFGSLQVRPKDDGSKAIWLVAHLYQSHLSAQEFIDTALLLLKEADFFDNLAKLTVD